MGIHVVCLFLFIEMFASDANSDKKWYNVYTKATNKRISGEG